MRPLTIVIPTYNEADNLPGLLSELLSLPVPDLSVLVVDDASPDGTGDLVEAWARREPGRVHLIRRPGKMGLGSAYIAGFRAALQRGAPAIGQMDADFSHSPAYIPGFCERLDDAEAVFGSRYVPGGSVDERWERGRVLLSRFGNIYARAILGLRVRDTTGGFRLWRGEALARFPLERVKSDGYVFQVEMAYIAQRLGLRSVELPIHFEDRRIGQSKMSFRIQVEAALRVWELPIRYRDLRRAHRG